jgi:hypothetical protein
MTRHLTVSLFLRRLMIPAAGALALNAATPRPARALDFGSLAGKATGAAGNAARDKAVKEANARLLAEGHKDQCSFKTDSAQLMPGCDAELG